MTKRHKVWSEEMKSCIKQRLRYDNKSGKLYWREGYGRIKNKESIAGWKTEYGYIRLTLSFKGQRFALMAHRVVWFLNYNQVPVMLDHINGKRDDNKIENLRLCTPELNQYNVKIKGFSKFKGVTHYWKDKDRWAAYGRDSKTKKTVYLGVFDTEVDAALAYDDFVILDRTELQGKFRKTNKELGLL